MPLYEDIQREFAIHDTELNRVMSGYRDELNSGLGLLLADLLLAFNIVGVLEPRRLGTRQDRLKVYLNDYVRPLLIRHYTGRRRDMPTPGAFQIMQDDFESARSRLRQILRDLIAYESSRVKNRVNTAVGAPILTRDASESQLRDLSNGFLILGVSIPAWARLAQFRALSKLDTDLTRGLMARERPSLLRNRIRKILSTEVNNTSTLARSMLGTVQNRVREQVYLANDDVIRGVWHSSVFDGKTSLICLGRGRLPNMYRLPGYARIAPTAQPYSGGPPYHPNCRSTMLPLFRRRRDLKDSVGRRKQNLIDRLGDTDFDTAPVGLDLATLASGSNGGALRSALGARRFELWERGRLSISDLLDQNGRPLRINELGT